MVHDKLCLKAISEERLAHRADSAQPKNPSESNVKRRQSIKDCVTVSHNPSLVMPMPLAAQVSLPYVTQENENANASQNAQSTCAPRPIQMASIQKKKAVETEMGRCVTVY